MGARHITLDTGHPEARFSATERPRIALRQAFFATTDPDWQRRLNRAALIVTPRAYDDRGRELVADHQVFRFSVLFNPTWPDPVFRNIRNWTYVPVELRTDAPPVMGWLMELRLRDLRLGPDERMEVVFLG